MKRRSAPLDPFWFETDPDETTLIFPRKSLRGFRDPEVVGFILPDKKELRRLMILARQELRLVAKRMPHRKEAS